MKKRNLFLITTTAVSAFAAVALLSSGKGLELLKSNAEAPENKIVLDQSTRFTKAEVGAWNDSANETNTAVRNTKQGNPITWKISPGNSATCNDQAKVVNLTGSNKGWVANYSPLNGITSLSIEVDNASGQFVIDFGVSAPLNEYDYDVNVPAVVENRTETQTGKTTYAYTLDGTYSYFRIQQIGSTAIWIQGLTVEYTCQHTHSYIHHDQVEPFREEAGVKEHYSCSCGELFDLNKNPTTKESLAIASRLYRFDNNNFSLNLPNIELGTTFYLDFKLDNSESQSEFGFMLGDGWSDYYGYFWVETSGNSGKTNLQANYGAGVTGTQLGDGYLRVAIELDETKIASGRIVHDDGGDGKVDNINLFYGNQNRWHSEWASSGYVDILPNLDKTLYIAGPHNYLSFEKTTITPTTVLSFDYKIDLTTGDTSVLKNNLMIHNSSTSKYWGDFGITNDPAERKNINGGSWQGVTFEDLPDGFTHITITFSKLNKANAKWDISEAPDVVDRITIHASWGGHHDMLVRGITISE